MTEEKDNKQNAEAKNIRQMISESYGKLGISAIPNYYAPEGITYDFCWGYRIFIPDCPVREKYRVRVFDLLDEHLCYDGVVGRATWIQSDEHYYKAYAIEITDAETKEIVFTHRFNLKDRDVLISFPINTIGDTLAWFPAVVEFQKRHDCKVHVAMAPHMRRLLEPANPQIHFIEREEMRTMRAYAFYQMGICFDGNPSMLPYDWRMTPLHWVGYNLLGLDPYCFQERRPLVNATEKEREIKEPYVCIGAMASGGCKLWLNPDGWDNVVDFLKKSGYRVIDIDGRRQTGAGYAFQKIPAGAEDWTGTGEGKELSDRAALLKHCDFYIGVGSGLSWLAWAMHKSVVLISGFSQPFCEFHTPYRVINTYVCHGCFNDIRYEFDGKDCYWCPKHKGTDKQLICSTAITSRQVINTIKAIPEFIDHSLKTLETRDAECAGFTVSATPDSADEVVKIVDGRVIDGDNPQPLPKGSYRPGDPGAKDAFEQLKQRLERKGEE